MPKTGTHKWEFRARFRRNAFGWKSQPAIKRIKEAVSEIKKVARTDKILAAEGAVLLLGKLSPALERIDSSSGAIGSAVNNAIATLVPIIAQAPASAKIRGVWLDKLWSACEEDAIPYIEMLGDYWGELCGSKEVASGWADQLLGVCRIAWSAEPGVSGFFKGSFSCLSALLAAERYDELLTLLEMAPYKMWHYRLYGVKALAAMGRSAEAIRYAEAERSVNDNTASIARTCEQVLFESGSVDEAYRRYGIEANRAGTYIGWFRAVAKRYPQKKPADILDDLVASSPGEEGKWFAAAKSAKLYDEAIALARRTPCSPQTLTRAARDFEERHPGFAIEAGLTALMWLMKGYGYEVTSSDVRSAYAHTMKAAERAGSADETLQRIRTVVANGSAERFVHQALAQELALS